MVRHKVRWMIVRLDFEEDIRSSPNKTSASSKEVDGGDSHSEALFPTKPEIYATLKSHLIQCFGVVAEAAAMDLQVRIVDPPTRLLLIRVSREWCNRVRASLTLLTTLSTRPEGGAALLSRRVIASAVSVNGSTRTAKLAMIAQARQFYRNERMKVSRSSYPSDVPTNRISRSLERLLATIQSID